MTLIEVLVVMVIVGVAVFGFMPRLSDIGQAGRDPVLEDINSLCRDMVDAALRSGKIQSANFALGKREIIWDEAEAMLPATVSRAQLNGDAPSGFILAFQVYPSGIMDEVTLYLTDGEAFVSSPLGGRFRREERR